MGTGSSTNLEETVLYQTAKMMDLHVNIPYKNVGINTVPVINDSEARNIDTSHAGRTVLVHTVWCMIHLYKWSLGKSWTKTVLSGLDIRTLLWAVFFHDIAKGTHCGVTCGSGKCVTDAYSAYAFNGSGDSVHNYVGAQIVMGRQEIFAGCPVRQLAERLATAKESDRHKLFKEEYNKSEKIGFSEDFFKEIDVDRKEIAVIVHMHWELGKVLAYYTNDNRKLWMMTSVQYVEYFKQSCILYGLYPTTNRLRMCIAVALADNAGSDSPCSDAASCLVLLDKIIAVDKRFTVIKMVMKEEDLLNYYKPPEHWKKRKWDTESQKVIRRIMREWDSRKKDIRENVEMNVQTAEYANRQKLFHSQKRS